MTGKLVGAITRSAVAPQSLGTAHRPRRSATSTTRVSAARARDRGPSALEIGERFFKATFEVMGHVAKSDGRVSEAEIAAARKVMAELRLNGVQIHAAIAHFTRGKNPDFDLEGDHARVRRCVRASAGPAARVPGNPGARCARRRGHAGTGAHRHAEGRRAARHFAARAGAHGGGAAHPSRAVSRRRAQWRLGRAARRRPRACSWRPHTRSWRWIPRPPDEEVAKAYRRQLSKHHPDKLKANGLPDSMLEHAKQRTQQIIEAYESIKSARQR